MPVAPILDENARDWSELDDKALLQLLHFQRLPNHVDRAELHQVWMSRNVSPEREKELMDSLLLELSTASLEQPLRMAVVLSIALSIALFTHPILIYLSFAIWIGAMGLAAWFQGQHQKRKSRQVWLSILIGCGLGAVFVLGFYLMPMLNQ